MDRIQEAIQMSQALEESMRMYEEENRRAPPDESLAVRFTCFGDCWLRITLSWSRSGHLNHIWKHIVPDMHVLPDVVS